MNIKIPAIPNLNWWIKVHGYKMPESFDKIGESDWLRATLHIRSNGKTTRRALPFLRIEELGTIVVWISAVRDRIEVKDLESVDPDFWFKQIHRDGVHVVQVIYRSDSKPHAIADQRIDATSIAASVAMLEEQIARFPCRCGQPHVHCLDPSAYLAELDKTHPLPAFADTMRTRSNSK